MIRKVLCLFGYLAATSYGLTYPPSPTTQYPAADVIITCGFGVTCASPYHTGLDLHGSVDDPVLSPVSGVVKEAQDHSGYGGTVIIEAQVGSEYVTYLIAHMRKSNLQVIPGQNVGIHQLLGYVAPTGLNGGTYAPHIHMGIRKGPYDSHNEDPCGVGAKWTYAGYTNCPSIVLNEWYDPESFTPAHCVGCYADSWHNDGTSQKFLDAYLANPQSGFGIPVQDPGNPQGIYVHAWNGANGIDVQNYDDTNIEKRGAILYKQGATAAYVVRAGFWDMYRYNNGPVAYGAPLSDEGPGVYNGISYKAKQLFELKTLLWDPLQNGGNVLVANPELPGISLLNPGNGAKVRAAGFNGGDELNLKVIPTTVAYDHTVISISDATGINYDYYTFYRNGLTLGNYPKTTTALTDYGVTANSNYDYRVEGGFTNWGIVSVSEAITVTTPPNPNTFDAAVSPRDPYTVDVTISDTLYNATLYNIYRDGQWIARTSGRNFSDFDVTFNTTYNYQVEALTGSLLHITSTAQLSVTTPDDPAPPPPPVIPPPQNPTFTLRIMEGVTVLEPPPAIINAYNTINFTIQNVGNAPISLDRVRADAYVDLGFQQVVRSYPADQFTPPLVLAPGARYTYQRDNANNLWPGVYGVATIKPVIKLYTIAGEWIVTDIDQNAVGYATLTILPANVNPDLIVTAVGISPVSPRVGDAVSAVFTVKNQGDALCPTPYLQVTKQDGTVISTLAPQIDVNQQIVVTMPLGTGVTGLYQLSYALDPSNFIHEWNETNNTGSFYYNVGPALPDFVPFANNIFPTNAGSDDPIDINLGFWNNAVGASSPAIVTVYLDGQLIATKTTFAMQPNWSWGSDFYVGRLSAGTHTYSATIDPANLIQETNETNNTLSGTFSIFAEPTMVLQVSKNVATNSVVLTWNNTADPFYFAWYAAGPTPNDFYYGTLKNIGNVTQYSLPGQLNDGKNYFYIITDNP